jgi:type II secretory pathway component PulM
VVFTKREKHLGIGIGAMVVVVALWYYPVSPYFERRETVAGLQRDTEKKLEDAAILFRKQRKLRDAWAKMRAGGLKSDPSETDTQVQHALRDWSQDCGLGKLSVKQERNTAERNFIAVSFHLTGSGPQKAVAKLLWAIENAPAPMRVDEVQVSPLKEGVDDLQLQLSLSALCLNPEAEKTIKSDPPRASAASNSKGDAL